METPDKRRKARYLVDDEVTVSVMRSPEVKHTGKVLNVSASGLQIELAVANLVGEDVEILVRGGVAIFGRVRYCRRVGTAFRAGIQIDDVVFASRPEHITEQLLSRYATGRGLTASEAIRILIHLEQCARCGAARDQIAHLLRRVRRAWGKLPDEP